MDHIKEEINQIQQPLSKLEILKKISAGTELRNAINDIVHGGLGAIIVISNSKVYDCFHNLCLEVPWCLSRQKSCQ